MINAHRNSFATRLTKNILLYSVLYLVVQSVAALNGVLASPLIGWLGLILSVVLLAELVFVTVRKSRVAVLSISPSLVLVLFIFTLAIRSLFGVGPIEWSVRNAATCVGIVAYYVGLSLGAAFGLRSDVRQELLNRRGA